MTINNSLRQIKNTAGFEPTYYFIKNIEEAYESGKCSKDAFKQAKNLYYQSRPMPSDY